MQMPSNESQWAGWIGLIALVIVGFMFAWEFLVMATVFPRLYFFNILEQSPQLYGIFGLALFAGLFAFPLLYKKLILNAYAPISKFTILITTAIAPILIFRNFYLGHVQHFYSQTHTNPLWEHFAGIVYYLLMPTIALAACIFIGLHVLSKGVSIAREGGRIVLSAVQDIRAFYKSCIDDFRGWWRWHFEGGKYEEDFEDCFREKEEKKQGGRAYGNSNRRDDFDADRFNQSAKEPDYASALRDANAEADKFSDKNAERAAKKFDKLSKEFGLDPKIKLYRELVAMLLYARAKTFRDAQNAA